MIELLIPDVWQQQAVDALRAGDDVIVDAPTSAGKTLVFESFAEHGLRNAQAIYTVPTRALANDKWMSWKARGWDVGLVTGDLSVNANARIVVATLETQRQKFLSGIGPRLLVLDEYQMIADAARGLMYELSIALAPPTTQLLLLSGSVGNPDDVVAWLTRLGRRATLVRTDVRPVPLEEIALDAYRDAIPNGVRSFWPQMIARAINRGLAPVLVFAPRRRAAEKLAADLAAQLPPGESLALSKDQEQLAGDQLSSLLKRRIAFHHSGLSYGARAGVVEPLARAGQLRAVVATTGLAAGINFSLRSVLVTDLAYMTGRFERRVEPHELLQMFGRAGRRGLDERGYALYTERTPRLGEARAVRLRRVTQVDWPVSLAVMRAAARRNESPFAAVAGLSRNLFATRTISFGVELSLADGPRACGLLVDIERARFSRASVVEFQNRSNEWEAIGAKTTGTLDNTWVPENDRWRPALSIARSLEGIGRGNLTRLPAPERARRYGREIQLGARTENGRLRAGPAVRRILAADDSSRVIPKDWESAEALMREHQQLIEHWTGGRFLDLAIRNGRDVFALFDFGESPVEGYPSQNGALLVGPLIREIRHDICMVCPALEQCTATSGTVSAALAWRELGLVEKDGTPTRRGVIVSFFQNGEGLAIAAALEDESYPIPEIIRDIADIRAGHRFSEDGSPFHGRLASACTRAYGNVSHEGYLELGLPPQFGGGAGEILTEILGRPSARQKFLSEELKAGDIERALLEWQSLLRHISFCPDYDWERWMSLKQAATGHETIAPKSANLTLPPLTGAQMRRIEHRLR
jgi:hypothetical protein